ncbi:UvrD-helicase domain-containing protein [Amycolatopsis sp. CA-230715]|uniref:UvrD-helicase domain-containing protein n=1 Tax=Amycolatopsis sp. CA-230715 TaxID=2745196 RepID=UPI001C0199F6|nr:UvrD-helicase domain-containing protein [Amycolatopsis sp. CA-230715]QWF77204.1 ATP-dependent DNA helicase Rep [Amycolatopsis sp. CA-230715]
MGISAHARRQAERQAAELVARLPDLGPPRRRVLTALIARTVESWHVFVRDDLPAPGTADAYLIGPGGVFAITVADGAVGEAAARATIRHAEERFAGLPGLHGQVVSGSAVHFVVVGGEAPGHWRVREAELDKLFRRDALHLDRRRVQAIVDRVAARLRGYSRFAVGKPEDTAEPDGLLDAEALTEDQVEAAQNRPFDTWLTFLHPQQQAVVTRNYNGPARISGPAGTGKTVVALHRLRHLARRSVGPVLFTTFVRTLPLVHRAAFERLAPEMTDRAEFTNLHAWARAFLASRGRAVEVDSGRVGTARSRAWIAHRDELEGIEPSPQYWETEIDRVLKGRGIDTFEKYAGAYRKGRRINLNARQKALVWAYYETYQRNLAADGLHDHNDVLAIALDELVREPLENAYAAVVVDEVQDITLTGLRLLRELAGDGPNRLLLVGDGQQQVYPGGWRLSDAGIPIQGRGEVLRVNYRNRVEVLTFAQRFDAMNHVDDLDGAAGVALRDAESANGGGEVRSWRGTAASLPAALLSEVDKLPVPRGEAAVITFHHQDVKRCTEILRKAGVETRSLDHFSGESDDRLKIGTVHRAKGLDFRAVLVVQTTDPEPAGGDAGRERRELHDRQHLVAATRARDFVWWGLVGNTGD